MKVGADSSDLDYFNTLSRQHLAMDFNEGELKGCRPASGNPTSGLL